MDDCRWYQHRQRFKLKACCSSSSGVMMRRCLQLQLLLLVLAAAGGGGGHGHMIGHGLRPNCTTVCGRVRVPYPFGIEAGCYLHESFKLTCNTTTGGSSNKTRLLFWLTGDTYLVTNISLYPSTVRYRPRRVISQPGAGPGLSKNWTETQPPLGSGCHLYTQQGRFDWEVGSSALQGRQNRTGPETCPRDLGSTAACHSIHSTCTATTGPYKGRPPFNHATGYVCKCDDGYQGNAYLPNGCQDINECTLRGQHKVCFGNCTNLPGDSGKYLCQCPKGTTGDPSTPNGCMEPHPNTGLMVGLGIGSGALLPFLIVGTTFIMSKIETRRKKKMRQRFFKQNRGQLLQQLVSQNGNISEKMIVVSLEEVEKATNNFDRTRELGGGAHGTVYKGILSSLHVVAIKKSKIAIQEEIDEFINEVAILSQINHRNIVKLHGCCLETEVPLLVYEFISSGTLYDHLHVDGPISLPWKDRMRIAVEAARALAYLHSLVSTPIIHRDVKSPNILLDSNLTVKLSDFGASRYIQIDQSGLDTIVQGTFGYLDPTYYTTGYLTDKSDVYSFGVILIELLTREKPVSYRSPEGDGLVKHFSTLVSERKSACILDPQVVKEGGGEVDDISLLAAMCVKFVRKERPTMRWVEMALESIHAAKEYDSSHMTDESEENYYNGVNDMSNGGRINEYAINWDYFDD